VSSSKSRLLLFHALRSREASGDKENIAPLELMPESASSEATVDLEKLLKSENARAPFQNFLQQQFCIENLNFYLAVEEYKLSCNEHV
jgi:hypothetical protein